MIKLLRQVFGNFSYFNGISTTTLITKPSHSLQKKKEKKKLTTARILKLVKKNCKFTRILTTRTRAILIVYLGL